MRRPRRLSSPSSRERRRSRRDPPCGARSRRGTLTRRPSDVTTTAMALRLRRWKKSKRPDSSKPVMRRVREGYRLSVRRRNHRSAEPAAGLPRDCRGASDMDPRSPKPGPTNPPVARRLPLRGASRRSSPIPAVDRQSRSTRSRPARLDPRSSQCQPERRLSSGTALLLDRWSSHPVETPQSDDWRSQAAPGTAPVATHQGDHQGGTSRT